MHHNNTSSLYYNGTNRLVTYIWTDGMHNFSHYGIHFCTEKANCLNYCYDFNRADNSYIDK